MPAVEVIAMLRVLYPAAGVFALMSKNLGLDLECGNTYPFQLSRVMRH